MSTQYTFKPESWMKTSKLVIEALTDENLRLISLATNENKEILFALPPSEVKALGKLLVAVADIEGSK